MENPFFHIDTFRQNDPWFSYRLGILNRIFPSLIVRPEHEVLRNELKSILEKHSCFSLLEKINSQQQVILLGADGHLLLQCPEAFYDIWDTLINKNFIRSNPYEKEI